MKTTQTQEKISVTNNEITKGDRKQIDNGEALSIKLTQIAGKEYKLTALKDKQIINILESSFGSRAIAKVNYFHRGLVICTPNKTPAIEELTREKEGIERTQSHNIKVKIEIETSTLKIVIKGFNPKQDNKTIENLKKENQQIKFIKIARRCDRKGNPASVFEVVIEGNTLPKQILFRGRPKCFEKFIRNLICGKCPKFGHLTKNCLIPTPTCRYCSQDHWIKECTLAKH